MDAKQIQKALSQQGQNPQKQKEDAKKEAEAQEKRTVFLQTFMTKEAMERLNNVKLVRPEKAKAIEDMIIRNGSTGAFKDKVTEDMLISFLENFQDKPATTITFKRKVNDDADDVDLDGL